jgi:hypothetical protein
VTPDDINGRHGADATDNDAYGNKRWEWADPMWANRGQTRIPIGRSEEEDFPIVGV